MMPRFLSALAAVASLSALAVSLLALTRLRETEERLEALDRRPAARSEPERRSADARELAKLREEIEALKARPEPPVLDADRMEAAVKKALEPKGSPAGPTVEDLAVQSARATLGVLSGTLALSADQVGVLGPILETAARDEARLWVEVRSDGEMEGTERAGAQIRARRDEAVRERLTIEQRAKFDEWLRNESGRADSDAPR